MFPDKSLFLRNRHPYLWGDGSILIRCLFICYPSREILSVLQKDNLNKQAKIIVSCILSWCWIPSAGSSKATDFDPQAMGQEGVIPAVERETDTWLGPFTAGRDVPWRSLSLTILCRKGLALVVILMSVNSLFQAENEFTLHVWTMQTFADGY